MKNLLRSIFAAGFCAVFILSCSKDKDEETQDVAAVDPCDRITVVSGYNYWGAASPTANLTYDDKGRITYVKGEGKNESTYIYYKDSIVLKATNIHGEDIGVTYYLDAKGRVKGTSFFDNKFTYDKDGYLISFRQPYTNNNQVVGYIEYTLKYENGDLLEISTTKENVSPKKVSFKYYDEPNQIVLGYNQPLYVGSVLGDRNSFFLIGAGFFGRQSTHLYKTLAFDNSPSYGQMEYLKDAKGRIVSNSAFAFEYQCP